MHGTCLCNMVHFLSVQQENNQVQKGLLTSTVKNADSNMAELPN